MDKPQWRNQTISDPADAQHLDLAAQTHGHTQAYQQYKRRQHELASAHHHHLAVEFQKMGQPKESARHRFMYEAHQSAIGKQANYGSPNLKLLVKSELPLHFTHHPADILL